MKDWRGGIDTAIETLDYHAEPNQTQRHGGEERGLKNKDGRKLLGTREVGVAVDRQLKPPAEIDE